MSTTTKLTPREQITDINNMLASVLEKLQKDVIVPINELLELGKKIIALYDQLSMGSATVDNNEFSQIEKKWDITVNKVKKGPMEIDAIFDILAIAASKIENTNSSSSAASLKSEIEKATQTYLNIMTKIEEVTPALAKKDETIDKVSQIMGMLKSKLSSTSLKSPFSSNSSLYNKAPQPGMAGKAQPDSTKKPPLFSSLMKKK